MSGIQGPDDQLGRVISGYRLERELGTGATGVVFLGRRVDGAPAAIEHTRMEATELPVEAAIKILVLPWQFKADERAKFRKRFKREAETLQALDHPHILPIITYGEDEATNSPYMILPYQSGGTLQDHLEGRAQPLPLAEVERLLDQIAGAVDYAHSQGIVHRDIKPGNILLDENGQAYLSDFSIAKIMGEETTRLTRTGMVPGTPRYMAPEALTGQDSASKAMDIYSLGMVAYELVVGPHITAVNPPTPPSALRPDLPRPAEAAILRALAPDPAQRFPTASAFAQSFARGLQGQWSEGLMTRLAAAETPDAASHTATAPTIPNPPPIRPTSGGRRGALVGALAGALAMLLIVALLFAVPGSPLHAMFASSSPTVGAGAQASATLTQTAAPTGSLTPSVGPTATTKKGATPTVGATSAPGAPPTATTVRPPTATPTPTFPNLVISATASQSTDGQAHGSGNPYYFTGNQTYGNVTIQAGAWAKAIAYCGAGGPGTVQFTATGTVRIDGVLTVNGEGYCGGPGIQGSGGGVQGDSYTGKGTTSAAANGGGGGGASGSDSGGGGGGYGTPGQPANNQTGIAPTYGGNTYGDPTIYTLYLGSGGGSSGAVFSNVGAPGGNGGGAISITANAIIVTGQISANGAPGGLNCQNGDPTQCRGSGGGSGGSILLKANTVSLGSNLVTATGGTGAYATHGGYLASGGNGGDGRIHIVCAQSCSGSTSPTAQ